MLRQSHVTFLIIALMLFGPIGLNTHGGTTTIPSGTLQLQPPVTTSPGSISGLVVHLDANNVTGTGNPADGSQISTWKNLATGGAGDFNLIAGSTQQPYVNLTGNPMNGNSVVHLWGGMLTNPTNFGNNITVMYTGRMDGGANQRLVSSVSNNWLLGYWKNNMNTVYWSNGGELSGTLDYNSHIFMATADGTTGKGYNIDEAEVEFNSRPLGQGPNGIALGGYGNSQERSYGDIGELLVFDHALSAADRLQMEQYLQAKWYGDLPSTEDVDITAAGATLDLNGVNQTLGSLTGVDGSQVLLNGGWLTLGQNSTDTTYSGTISDGSIAGGGLSKIGTGTLTLGGTSASTFTGPTVISQGEIAVSSSAGVTAIPGDILMLNSLNPNMWVTADNQLGGNGVLSFANEVNSDLGHARFNLTGTTQSVAGIVTTDIYRNGVIQNSETYGGAPTNNGTSTLVLTGSGDYSFNGYLRNATGTLKLTKTGTGTQELVGNLVNYTGDTTVSGGTLKLTDTTAFSSSINNTATVQINAASTGDSWNLNPGKTLSGNGTWIKTGPGRASLRNVIVTASGLFQIQEGTVRNDHNSSNWTSSTLGMDIWAAGVLDLYADDISVDALTGDGTVQNDYAPSGTQTLTVGVANGSGTFDGAILGTGGSLALTTAAAGGNVALTKVGTGTQVLAGTNTYTGPTTVNGGTLRVDGSITSNVLVQTGWLEGGGTITGNVNVLSAAGISAGDMAGHLSITGDLDQMGTMVVQLGGTTQGVNYDRIEVDGLVTLGGIVDVDILGGFSPGSGTTFDILTATNTVFDDGFELVWDPLGLLAAQGWDYQILGDTGSGQILQLFVTVPEPSTLLLAALAMAGLLGLIRRRRVARLTC